MSEALPACATCSSDAVVKNGQTRHRKQNYKCRDCGRQFVEEPQWRAVSVEHRAIIDRLLLEKIPLAAIARAMQVSEQWLQTYVNAKYASLQQKVQVTPKPKHRLTVQMDELWSFVNDKDHEQWVWLAIDADTRSYCGLHYWRPQRQVSTSLVGFPTSGLSPMCSVLHRFLVILSGCLTQQTTSSSRERNWTDELY